MISSIHFSNFRQLDYLFSRRPGYFNIILHILQNYLSLSLCHDDYLKFTLDRRKVRMNKIDIKLLLQSCFQRSQKEAESYV